MTPSALDTMATLAKSRGEVLYYVPFPVGSWPRGALTTGAPPPPMAWSTLRGAK
jgi:hypothetical protein